MRNFVKVLIVSFSLYLINFFNLTFANEVKRVDYDNAYCFESSNFAQCKFYEGYEMTGGLDQNGQWSGPVKYINDNQTGYYFYRSGDIGYGIVYYSNGYYVGDMSSDGTSYGYGTYYFNNGDKRSYKNWEEEKKLGYYRFADGSMQKGRFDANDNLLIQISLDKDFQMKLNEMERLARSVEPNFNKNFSNFLALKNNPFSNDTKISQTNPTKTTYILNDSSDNNKNLLIGLTILAFFIFFLWVKGKSSKKKDDMKKTNEQNHKPNNEYRYKNYSIADSKKLYKYGVTENMTLTEACRQLRTEYFKWATVSNNQDALKKSLSQKNLNNIISLREKLKC